MSEYPNETEFLGRVMKYLPDIKLTDRGGEIGYREAYKSNGAFTEFISALVDKISADMELNHYREYYSIDHVLYNDKDVVLDLPEKQVMLKERGLSTYGLHSSMKIVSDREAAIRNFPSSCCSMQT